jgi:hypothetical protein
MTLTVPSEIREVHGLSSVDKQLIEAFMQGAVYSWVKNLKGKWFAVRDLVGGENTDWSGTPLQQLYNKHIDAGKINHEAFEAAAKDIGWIVKAILANDKRVFENDNTGFVNSYRWIENAS